MEAPSSGINRRRSHPPAAVSSARTSKPSGIGAGAVASTMSLPGKKKKPGDPDPSHSRSGGVGKLIATPSSVMLRRHSSGGAVPEESSPDVTTKRESDARTLKDGTRRISSMPVGHKLQPHASPKTEGSLRRNSSSRPPVSGKLLSSVDVGNAKGATLDVVQRARAPSYQRSSSARRILQSPSLPSSSDRKKTSPTLDGQHSLLITLPQIDVKAGDDLRMDLRGHRIRSLTAKGLSLCPSLEFAYFRDNLLSSLEGIERLSRVKVLDLSFNEFKGPGFEPLGNCKTLQQLYLAGNHITSLASLPELPNLEFLSVAQNRLKSLCMASQPRLQVLAASKNKICTLKGFPHFPVLEHLRIEENPVLEVLHLEAAVIILVGPTLKKFNDRDLSLDEAELSKRYPAHTALCIRDGWEFCVPELAAESTFLFLFERWKNHFPPGYVLKEASVDHPFEEDICQCNFVFANDQMLSNVPMLELKYQWFIGEKTCINFVPIFGATSKVYLAKHEDVGKFLKVECTPVCGGIEYRSVFAISSPVSAGVGCPKVLNITVHGNLKEGNVIKGHADVAWCGGTPGNCVASWLRRKWNSSPVVIVGAEDEEYLLTVDDIDASLVFMYTPVTLEGVKGEAQYAMTDFVKAAPPSVAEVQIVGDVVEGNTIKGTGRYFGGREGPSKYEWLRENKETRDQLLVSVGDNEYTLTKDDVGWRMVFCYKPVNFEGQEGTSGSCVTDAVRKASPRVRDLKLVGDLREGRKVTVASVVIGGTEGSSRVQWFKSKSINFEADNQLEAISTSKIAKAFRIPLSAVGYYLVAKFTPMAPDGEAGEPGYIFSEKAVENLPPSLNFLAVTGEPCEGETLTASYGYIGGHEGKSLYNWYLHENDIDTGVLVPEASGSLQYRVTKEAINKFVSFKCTPIRDDNVVGETRLFIGQDRARPGNPKLLSLHILGECVEGNTLIADKKYWGGDEGNSIFQWILISDDGLPTEIEGATSSSYTLAHGNVGRNISVSCQPVRSDGAVGPAILSEQVGPILPGLPVCKFIEFVGSMMEGQRLQFNAEYFGGEKGSCSHEWYRVKSNGLKQRLSSREFLDLTLLDVGGSIELIYTPIRIDGIKGTPKSIVSNVISPAKPKGNGISLPDCFEDQEVIPKRCYFGGLEGEGSYIWYRTKRQMDNLDILKLSEILDDAIVVGKSLTYTPSLEDVGAYLIIFWVPTRDDGETGIPVAASTDFPVFPAPPSVSDVCVKEVSRGIFSGEGIYHGGYEGSSLFSWYRVHHDGSHIPIDGERSLTYKVSDLDYNCRLLFSYTPVRSDSVIGECKFSESTFVILPELLEIESISFMGKGIEGETLAVVEIIPENERQQHVWKKYKKEVRYKWFTSTTGDTESFKLLPSHFSSYNLQLEDIGRYIKCECFVVDIFGRPSVTASAVTTSVLPGIPKIRKLEIEGRGFHTNLYAVHGVYSGGREGKSRIQWLRSTIGSPDLITISGETGRMYEANVDDVGYRLVAVYTPVRDDGIEGESVFASTEAIAVEPDVYREVKQKVELGSVKFEVLYSKDHQTQKVAGVGQLEKRILEVNRKRVKVVKPGSKSSFPATQMRATYVPPFHVELFRNDQHRFKIVADNEEEVELMVQTRHMRDVIVLVIRGLAQKFNSTSLNSLLKIDTQR